MNILELDDVAKSFGGLKAVNRVSLTLEEGEAHSIIGPNGAGKTTLFNLLTGDLKPDSGRILFSNKDIGRRGGVRKFVAEGIGRSFQIANFFTKMSAYESIAIAVLARQGRAWHPFQRPGEHADGAVRQILGRVGMTRESAALLTGELPTGDMKRVEIGMVIALKPKLILLDEPTAGMSRVEKNEIVELLKELNQREGYSMIVVEHDTTVVSTISRKIWVMHRGEIISAGTPEEIRNSEIVRKVYLGEE